MIDPVSPSSLQRRKLLAGLMKLLVLIGLGFVAVPLLSTFSTNSIDEKKTATSRWVITLPVTELNVGEVKELSWAGGQVWVYSRTAYDIQQLNKPTMMLRDALSDVSDQPENMKHALRSFDDNHFVFIPHENIRNCQVSLVEGDGFERFTEPCYRARYDAAGRILKDSGHAQQLNLAVPEHVVEEGILKIGIWMPKL